MIRHCGHDWECDCPTVCDDDPFGCIKLGKKTSKVAVPGKLLVCTMVPGANCDDEEDPSWNRGNLDGTIFIEGNLAVAKDLDLNGTVRQPSDDRIKTDIEAISADESLALIRALQPQSYSFTNEWQHATGMSGAQRGFIAQDVAQVLPELVHVADERIVGEGSMSNFHSVDYIGLIPDLVGALQASHTQVESMQAEMIVLRELLEELHG